MNMHKHNGRGCSRKCHLIFGGNICSSFTPWCTYPNPTLKWTVIYKTGYSFVLPDLDSWSWWPFLLIPPLWLLGKVHLAISVHHPTSPPETLLITKVLNCENYALQLAKGGLVRKVLCRQLIKRCPPAFSNLCLTKTKLGQPTVD